MRSSSLGQFVRAGHKSWRTRLSFALAGLGLRLRGYRVRRFIRTDGEESQQRLGVAVAELPSGVLGGRSRLGRIGASAWRGRLSLVSYVDAARAEAWPLLRRLGLAVSQAAIRAGHGPYRLWQVARVEAWPVLRGRVSLAATAVRAQVGNSALWQLVQIETRPTARRRLRFAVVVVISQMLLMALAVAWLIHMIIIAVNGSVYFVEQNPVILWIEISATILIILFAAWVFAGQVRRLGERRRSDDRRGGDRRGANRRR